MCSLPCSLAEDEQLGCVTVSKLLVGFPEVKQIVEDGESRFLVKAWNPRKKAVGFRPLDGVEVEVDVPLSSMSVVDNCTMKFYK